MYRKEFPTICTGTRTVLMSVQVPVPSTVNVLSFEYRVWYPGQTLLCCICQEPGHLPRACPLSGLCRRCKQPGHKAGECPHGRGHPSPSVQSTPPAPVQSSVEPSCPVPSSVSHAVQSTPPVSVPSSVEPSSPDPSTVPMSLEPSNSVPVLWVVQNWSVHFQAVQFRSVHCCFWCFLRRWRGYFLWLLGCFVFFCVIPVFYFNCA